MIEEQLEKLENKCESARMECEERNLKVFELEDKLKALSVTEMHEKRNMAR
jgi:hypothetical protein